MGKESMKKKIEELHESIHLSLEDFEQKYADNEANGSDDYKRTDNIINEINYDIFKLKNEAENENDELKKRIKHLNHSIKKEKLKNEELSAETLGFKNSSSGAEQLLKDKESLYFTTVLMTVNFLISVIGLSFLIYNKK